MQYSASSSTKPQVRTQLSPAYNRLFGLTTAAVLLAAIPATPLQAQEDEPAEQAKDDDWKKQISDLTTKLEALRNKPADSLKDGAGAMEATILSSEALNAAARDIALDISQRGEKNPADTNSNATQKPVVIMSGGALPDMDAYLALSIEIDGLKNLLNAHQGTADNRVTIMGALPIAGIGEVLSLLSSLLRSETEISDLPGSELDANALGMAVASALVDKKVGVTLSNRILFTDWRSDPNTSTLIGELSELASLADNIRTGAKQSDEQKAVLKRYDDFIVRIQTPVDGKVPLLTALRAAKFTTAAQTHNILELKVEKVGGTLLKRKNLAVALGASSLGITGGSVVSYSLTDKDGVVQAAGLLHCGTTLTNFKKVHQRHKIVGKCNSRKPLAAEAGKG